MSTTKATGQLKVEWDDSVVLVFSFQDAGATRFCGFVHTGLASQYGTQTQVTKILQTVQSVQYSADPGTWVETVKSGARSTSPVTVTYDDNASQPYTTATGESFDLQILFSIAG